MGSILIHRVPRTIRSVPTLHSHPRPIYYTLLIRIIVQSMS